MDLKTYLLHIAPGHAEHYVTQETPTSLHQTWRPCTYPDTKTLTLSPGTRYRAPAVLHGQGCPPWLWRGIASTRVHPRALAAGVSAVDHDGGPWIYLSGQWSIITADMPILICEVRSSREERALHAVEILRQAGLPAEAEALHLAASAATTSATVHAHHARQLLGIALDRVTAQLKHLTETQALPKLPLGMAWPDIRAVVGDV
jgi:hypothetical protein